MFLIYVLLGLVQGILEWLPVSSEGQLIIIAIVIGEWTTKDALSLAFWLHLGTMFAVFLIYRREWRDIIDLRVADSGGMRRFLILTTIGTAVTGIPVKLYLEDLDGILEASKLIMWIIGISLLITSLLIYYSRRAQSTHKTIKEMSTLHQLVIGFAQGFAIIPGISRSGTTVSALLFSKVEGQKAFSSSFMMAVPASLGSVVLDILFAMVNDEPLLGSLNPLGILLGIVSSFIFGVLTMKALIELARRVNFAVITLVFGLLIILLLLIF